MPKLTPKMKAKQWTKGQSGNPKGRLPLNPVQKALRLLTIDTYREVIQIVLDGDIRELKRMIEDPTTKALQVGIATAFLKAIKTGDYAIIERIAERIVGKIPDELKVTSNNNTNLQVTAIDREMLKRELAKLESDV